MRWGTENTEQNLYFQQRVYDIKTQTVSLMYIVLDYI